MFRYSALPEALLWSENRPKSAPVAHNWSAATEKYKKKLNEIQENKLWTFCTERCECFELHCQMKKKNALTEHELTTQRRNKMDHKYLSNAKRAAAVATTQWNFRLFRARFGFRFKLQAWYLVSPSADRNETHFLRSAPSFILCLRCEARQCIKNCSRSLRFTPQHRRAVTL